MSLILDLLLILVSFILFVISIVILVKIYKAIMYYLNQYYFPEKNFKEMFPNAKLVHTNVQTLQQIQPEVDFEKLSLQFKPGSVVKNITRSKGKLFVDEKEEFVNIIFVNDLKANNFKIYNLLSKDEINLSKILYSYEPEYGSENKFYVLL